MLRIQSNDLLDLCYTCMRQAHIPYGAMDESTFPSVLLQGILQMLTNAACRDTLFCKQNNFIISQFFDQFICKGIYLYKLQHIIFDILCTQFF